MRVGAQNNSKVSPCMAGIGVEIRKTGLRADVGEQRVLMWICADFECCTCFWGLLPGDSTDLVGGCRVWTNHQPLRGVTLLRWWHKEEGKGQN